MRGWVLHGWYAFVEIFRALGKSRSAESHNTVYANNQYAGFSPATVSLFRSLCNERGIKTPLNMRLPEIIEGTLFDMSGSSN
jgi:hypothetical protein